MTDQAVSLGDVLSLVAWIVGVAITIIGGLIGVVVLLLTRNADRTSRESDGRGRRQASQGELMAGVMARLTQVEEAQSKLADAMDRLTRLEEFRLHAMPKLVEAEETARTVIAFGEQMKTIFRRIDTMTEQMNKLPEAVAAELRTMIRPVQGRAANG